MKRIFALFLSILLVFGTAACSSSQPGGNNESFKLKVGFDAEYPPFGFINDQGKNDGFDLALAAEVCKRLGWAFEAVPISWDAKDAELESGNINCIWNGFTINGREDDYTWTVGYYDNSVVMVVRAGNGIQSLADLAGKTVMTQAASSALNALEKSRAELTATFAELKETADYNSAFMELESGAVDAVAVDVGVANYFLATQSGSYVILDEAISSEQYGIGFKKGDVKTMYTVQGVLLEMAADGTMMAIAQKYEDKGLVLGSLVLPALFE